MTKDDVMAEHAESRLAYGVCQFCDTLDLVIDGDADACHGCLVAYAISNMYWLQRQRQQTAKEREDATDGQKHD